MIIKYVVVYFLRWLIGLGYLIDGVVRFVTFGFVSTGLPLRLSEVYARTKFKLLGLF